MAKVYAFEGLIPVIAEGAYVHPEAVLIGDVIVESSCYIGPCACLRGDFGRIIIKAGANIQDGCVLHSFPERDLLVDEGGHVGHGAILHGCVVGKNALVGMNAVVMDDVDIGENSFVAAHAFVKARDTIPANHLAAGSPARVVRLLTEQEIGWKTGGTRGYQRLAERCMTGLEPAQALTEVEENRPRTVWNDQAMKELHVLKASETRE